MRIAVMGAGGIGGYVGGRLAEAGESVHFVARGAHLEALQRAAQAGVPARQHASRMPPTTRRIGPSTLSSP